MLVPFKNSSLEGFLLVLLVKVDTEWIDWSVSLMIHFDSLYINWPALVSWLLNEVLLAYKTENYWMLKFLVCVELWGKSTFEKIF